MSKTRKVALGVATGLAMLILAELVLRLAGCQPGHRMREVEWSLRDQSTFFVKAGRWKVGRKYPEAAGPSARVDHTPSFFPARPVNSIRIFCLGGSAAYGVPYSPKASLSGWLDLELKEAFPLLRFEVINAAQPGVDSLGVRAIGNEVLRYAPNLLVVYCGNNEFLPHNLARARAALASPRVFWLRSVLDETALYGLMKDVLFTLGWHPTLTVEAARPELDRKSCADSEREWILRRFRENMTALGRACARASVKLAICGVPSNLRDYDPNISRHPEDMSPEALARWESHFREGERLLAEGNPAAATAQLRLAEAIDAHYADLHYQLGRCLEQAGHLGAARVEYVEARNLDRYPTRAVSAVNEIVREVCRATGALFVDLEAIFAQRSEHGLPGYSLFQDHCHLTLRASRLAALEVIRAVSDAGLLPRLPLQYAPRADEMLDCDALFGLTPACHAAAREWIGIQLMREVTTRSPNRPRLERAKMELRQAIALDPKRANALLHLGLILVAEDQREEAIVLARRALSLNPHVADGHAYALRTLRELGLTSR